MLEPYRYLLKEKKIILASSSPRRKEIFENILSLNFTIEKSDFEENLDKSKFLNPNEYAKATALRKTEDVVMKIIRSMKTLPDIVVGADTVVFLDGEIIEKPIDSQDAINILQKLNGRRHGVCTGVILMTLKSKEYNGDHQSASPDQMYDISTFDETSYVEFDHLTEDVIHKYVKTEEPLDKAGGYGIQSLGGTLIKAIDGDYFNVMGFPANRFARELVKWFKNDC